MATTNVGIETLSVHDIPLSPGIVDLIIRSTSPIMPVAAPLANKQKVSGPQTSVG